MLIPLGLTSSDGVSTGLPGQRRTWMGNSLRGMGLSRVGKWNGHFGWMVRPSVHPFSLEIHLLPRKTIFAQFHWMTTLMVHPLNHLLLRKTIFAPSLPIAGFSQFLGIME